MTNDKIKIIRDFIPIPKPQFDGDEHAMRYMTWNLYTRICEANKSFIVLLDNQQYYDAFLIAGHTLETCSILSYINDCNSEAKCLEHYNKYLAKSAFGRLHAILEINNDLKNDFSWNAYMVMQKIFYPVGATIIRDNKNQEEKHREAIEKLKNRIGSNKDKIRILNKFYAPMPISQYIFAFAKNMGNIDDGLFKQYYNKYCSYKHSNMLAPGTLSGDIDNEEINWFLDLMHGIIIYLKNSKFIFAETLY